MRSVLYLLLIFALIAPLGGRNTVHAQSASPQSSSSQSLSASGNSAAAQTPPDLSGLMYMGMPPEIAQDKDLAGLQLELLRLGTTARLLQVVAHPDDEDGGMLTLEARGHGVNAVLMTLTRGEGGQNRIGSNLSDGLGVLRSLELLASDQYYGVQDRFSRVADFGFSKTADETFEKWGGHGPALADIVRVIRTFRPDVLVPRFSGTERDGHGNHQVSGKLAIEAFRAAADPNKFPEQIAEGLQPWQPKKLYNGNVCGFGANSCVDEKWTVKLNTGEKNATLGMSYIQFSMQGLRHQLSQGAANWTVDPGDRFTFYKLVDSATPPTLDKNGHEKDFFDGLDTSLPALASRLGTEEAKVPWLPAELHTIAEDVSKATEESGGDGSGAARPLFDAVQRLDFAIKGLLASQVSGVQSSDVLDILQEKHDEAENALNLALNVTFYATVVAPAGPPTALPNENDALTVVSPGQTFAILGRLHNGSRDYLTVQNARLDPGAGWVREEHAETATIAPNEDYYANFLLRVPSDAEYTRPYWHRDDPDREAITTVDDERYATLPFPPPQLRVRADYEIAGRSGMRSPEPDFMKKLRKAKPETEHSAEVSADVWAPFRDEQGKRRTRQLAVAPVFSVALEPGEQVIPLSDGEATRVRVGVRCNLTGAPEGKLRLQVPEGWNVEPPEAHVALAERGQKQDFEFTVHPASLAVGRAEIRAVLDAGSERYNESYTLVTRQDLGSFYYYQPARQRVSIVDVKVPHDLKVGYLMGAGDDIPTVLQQVGLDVTLIDAGKLASEDLSRYQTIVLGIRAYDTQKPVAENNKKLLDFVSAGGTLVVQYNTSVGEFNDGHFTPYPAELSRDRVSVEEAPVELLAPEDPVFHSPNTITARDFDGWVQERGLYFMDSWDDHFKPLLSCHDPGEDAKKGGLLIAHYGKGIYIYTGYAFFRQLPAGVPGAVRLYVNLLNAGRPYIQR